MGCVNYSLSFSDLEQIDGFVAIYESNDEEKMKALLWRNGVDVTQPYEWVECLHRNLRNKMIEGKRLYCMERLDNAWVKSPYATSEAKLYTDDVSLRKELGNLSRDGLDWEVYCAEASKHYERLKETETNKE